MPSPITRSELISMMNERLPVLSNKSADEAVRILFEEMGKAITSGRRIEIRGFGSFSLNYRPARIGRNPRTGESVRVPPKYSIHFKPGKEMREVVDSHARKPLAE